MALTRPQLRVLFSRIKVVIFRSVTRPWHVAQCLEYDLNAQGITPEKALSALVDTIVKRIALDEHHRRPPLSTCREADERYWRMYFEVETGASAPLSESAEKPDEVPSSLAATIAHVRIAA